MDQGQLIISLVSIVVMFLPIGILLWKISRIVFKVEVNTKDINLLSERIKKQEDIFNERLNESENKLNNISLIMARMEEKINNILEKINEK
jgi:predicted  nucleic acid-binding Zn-ribbon protein